MDYEADWIRCGGLEPLSRDLVLRRLRAANEHGHITGEERAALEKSNVYEVDGACGRDGQVCLTIGEAALADVPGCWPLLATWGGEAIYFPSEHLEERLRGLGRPTIVEVALDLGAAEAPTYTAPGLGALFVAAARGEAVSADVHFCAPVARQAVIGLYGPGDCAYDRHAGLPA